MGLHLIEMEEGFSCYASGEFEARFIYQEIFKDNNYDQPGLPEAPFTIDVGANIGLFSLYMKQKYPAARIIAFEPAPENYQALRQNLELHQVGDVTVYPYAVGSEAREATFTYYPAMPGNSTLHPEEKALQKRLMGERLGEEAATDLFQATTITVKVDRLSRFLAEQHPGVTSIDLLKIDVEGAELEVLRGIDDADWAKVQNVLLEVNNADGALAQVEALLREKGLTVASEPVPLMWEELELYYVTAHR
ncbi:FkbM family methyltransferase [Streptantibioticus ferralitis]|uniref:FkbM family methyltransferase n=1 Tax=Streptantibioticus ferralitis TaxID=236510 RepID=A0ABT5YYN5_9ACTN|nr:FkbM family methyltransferase [Streptantibioticus ferralitis]MDF2256532.1 FkbM family methyltransferase [Streptantibioticus ferralitis]